MNKNWFFSSAEDSVRRARSIFFSPRDLSALFLLAAALNLPAAFAEEVKESTKLVIRVNAGSGVNPDEQQRANPVKVRVYELKNSESFEQSDYFTLDNSDRAVLAQDMAVRDEFILRPGEHRIIERKSNPQTTAIGILAGYRDLAHSVWRYVYKLKEAPEAAWYRAILPANKAEFTVNLEPQGIVVVDKP